MGHRKSRDVGRSVNGYLVLDSEHRGTTTYYQTKCERCGAVDWYSRNTIVNGHAMCRQCEGGRRYHARKGQRGEQLYGRYYVMLRRCGRRRGYEHVRVCDEWLESYEAFRDWALANGYSDGLTIDRVDNDRGYSPDNCRWVTPEEQANNRRSNVRLTLDGRTMTAAEWGREMGLPPQLVSQRRRRGWSDADCILTPYKSRVKHSEMGVE